MEAKFTVQKVSDEKYAFKNALFLNPDVKLKTNYVILTVNGKKFSFYCLTNSFVKSQYMAMTLAQRKWSGVTLDHEYNVTFFQPKNVYISKLVLTITFLQKTKITLDLIDSEKLLASFLAQFSDFPLSVSQIIHFSSESHLPPFELVVQELFTSDVASFVSSSDTSKKADFGILSKCSKIVFKRAQDGPPINLVGKASETAISATPLISPDWDFSQMGIGGLDKEFSVIFRRAFASRLFPPEMVHQLGLKHVRGILLYGPPGTGKTLMARQIGKMLNCREPKIVHGPDILNKYVGESEANIRKLFAEAEAEEKKMGINSGIHIIIFDEIDAICKQRGTTGGSTGVHDTVVNQLLSKIDGVEQLNNVLIIGMTNRKDLIDDALLRPGRLEVQMQISLPDENGRLQILNIHTSNLKKYKKLEDNVDLSVIAQETKNYSGAEIEGLVKAATSIAMNRAVKIDGKVNLDPKAVQNLKVSMSDFNYALENDIKPMFGASTADLSLYVMNGIVDWSNSIKHLLSDGDLLIEQTRNGGIISPVSLLLEGVVGSGKTALAARLALSSKFPLIKLCSADQMVGYTELAKCQYLKQIFDDATKSELSCVVIDNIERILEYVPIGPRFANTVLQALMVLLNKRLPNKHKLLIIATTSCMGVMNEMGVSEIFTRTLNVPQITDFDEIKIINDYYNFFPPESLDEISTELESKRIMVPIKKLLSVFEMAAQASLTNSASKSKFIQLMAEERFIK